MIVHKISLYKHPQEGLDKHYFRKNNIFERTLKKLDRSIFYEGREFQVKGTNKKGTLIFICENIHEVEWDGFKVKFLELYFNTKDHITGLYHPSDLKEIKYA